jgi:hypothetical protein
MPDTDTDTFISTRARALVLAALFGLGSVAGVAACSDEDGDGGETDEEIQEGEDTVDSVVDEVEDEVDEEVDAQNEGSNQDDE